MIKEWFVKWLCLDRILDLVERGQKQTSEIVDRLEQTQAIRAELRECHLHCLNLRDEVRELRSIAKPQRKTTRKGKR